MKSNSFEHIILTQKADSKSQYSPLDGASRNGASSTNTSFLHLRSSLIPTDGHRGTVCPQQQETDLITSRKGLLSFINPTGGVFKQQQPIQMFMSQLCQCFTAFSLSFVCSKLRPYLRVVKPSFTLAVNVSFNCSLFYVKCVITVGSDVVTGYFCFVLF